MKLLLLSLVFILAVGSTGYCQNFHTSPLCWDHPRLIFYGADADVSHAKVWQKAHLFRRVDREMPPGYERSPNEVYAFHLGQDGDSNDYELLVFNERPYLFSVLLTGVKSVQDVKWVSEHLLYLRVWLGRIAGVDLFLDAEREAIVRVEPFHDGTIALQQWRESCADENFRDTDLCNPSCHRLDEDNSSSAPDY